MARLARIVVPGLLRHVTQRGNRRQKIFFEHSDYALYRDFLAERHRKTGAAVWAYCLMADQVHLILVPATENRLSLALACPSGWPAPGEGSRHLISRPRCAFPLATPSSHLEGKHWRVRIAAQKRRRTEVSAPRNWQPPSAGTKIF